MNKQSVAWDFDSIAKIYNVSLDSEALKSQILIAAPKRYAFRRIEEIEGHLEMLAHEFHEKTLLDFYVPWLTVHLRRKIDVDENWPRFWNLVEANKDYLCQSLDLRWIVSIADSVIDHSTDQAERGLALSILLLLNTVKFYETERYATGQKTQSCEYATIPGDGPVDLGLDGLSAFLIGHGDAVENLIRRANTIANSPSTMGAFLAEAIRRIQSTDTVYRRFGAVQK